MRENKETLGTIQGEVGWLSIADKTSLPDFVHRTGQLAFEGYAPLREWRTPSTHVPRERLFPPSDRIILPRGERLKTPIDNRGLVDLGKLVTQVVACVDEDYKWRGEEDDHHLYWFNAIYGTRNLFMQDEELGRKFRGLPLHIVRLPKELHAFLHAITLPVEAPTTEVMEYRIESWRIAKDLFNSVRIIKNRRYLTNDEAARRVNKQVLEDKFKQLEKGLRRASKLPEEFRFFGTKHLESVAGARNVWHVKKHDLDKALKTFATYEKAARKGIVTLSDIPVLAA